MGGGKPLGTLQFGKFLGDIPMIKGDVSYDKWIYEVKVGRACYSDSVLKEGMIHSLKGSATETMRHLGPGVSMDEIITKWLRCMVMSPHMIVWCMNSTDSTNKWDSM